MNIVYFLASKIRKTPKTTFSSTVINVGVASIAIGIITMTIAFSVLFGFKSSIKEKLFGLNAHLQVGKITLNRSYDETPLDRNSETIEIFKKNSVIKSFNSIATKAAILKSENEINGIILKGIATDYDSSQFISNLKQGRWINLNDTTDAKEIVISEYLAKKMGLKLNDNALIYFVQNPPRARSLKIVGIYSTGLIDFDKNLLFCDLKLIQKLNGWESNQIGHFEVLLKDFDKLEITKTQLLASLPQDLDVQTITKSLPQFFEWFDLLDRNIVLVIVLIMVVAAFNMVSVLLIMIMERIPMIGLLKALGMRNKKIRMLFITNGFLIIVKGLLIGNIVGVFLILIQKYWKIIPLDPENYYVEYVPVMLDFKNILFTNLLVIVIVGLTLLLPTLFIKNINPVTAIKYKD